MCDTLYARPWFAKNSDRHPEEAQGLFLVEPRPSGGAIIVGGRRFPGTDLGLALALSKPSWIEGAEMGVNGAGVAIGNEAVFAKRAADPEAPLGMDLLRACLMAADSARAALEWLIEAVETVGQGGNGAYRGRLVYDNSFLVADAKEAYVLETAGRRWAWRSLVDLGTISNAYSLHDDYEALDGESTQALCRAGRPKASWAKTVASPLHPLVTRGPTRSALTRASLEAAPVRDLNAILGALRSHGAYRPGRPGSLASPCVHEGGFPVDNATTASLAFQWRLGREGARGPEGVLWYTGTSYPCLSLFKPIILKDGRFRPLWGGYDHDELSGGAYDTWARHLAWSRKGHHGALSLDAAFAARLRASEAHLVELASRAMESSGEGYDALGEEVGGVVEAWEAGLPGREPRGAS